MLAGFTFLEHCGGHTIIASVFSFTIQKLRQKTHGEVLLLPEAMMITVHN